MSVRNERIGASMLSRVLGETARSAHVGGLVAAEGLRVFGGKLGRKGQEILKEAQAYYKSGLTTAEREAAEGRLGPVLEMLSHVPEGRIHDMFDARSSIHPDAEGNSTYTLPISAIGNGSPSAIIEGITYEVAVVRTSPRSVRKSKVQPRHNQHTEEVYRFLSGDFGFLWTGKMENGHIQWRKMPRFVKPGDFAIISKGEAHAFVNYGTRPFDYLLASPNTTSALTP